MRFGRGSYGEVWLAYNPDYHQDSNASYSSGKNSTISSYLFIFMTHTSEINSFAHYFHAGPPDDNLFIWKRMMVNSFVHLKFATRCGSVDPDIILTVQWIMFSISCISFKLIFNFFLQNLISFCFLCMYSRLICTKIKTLTSNTEN